MQRKESKTWKKEVMSILLCMVLVLMSLISVYSNPPVPHPVIGRVTTDSGNGVQNGVPVLLNNSNETESITYTEVFAPIPPLAGQYSATVSAENNDTLVGTAYNATHFGENRTNMSDVTTELNIVIDTPRPSEPNVSLFLPPNNSLYNVSQNFNITTNVTILGGDGTACYINVSFSNPTVLNVTADPELSQFFASINAYDSVRIVWNGTAIGTGVSNITVRAACGSDGRAFESVNVQHRQNITVVDVTPPQVNLVSPENGTINNAFSNFSFISFHYNVSDDGVVGNCSLYINSTINLTNHSVELDTPIRFVTELQVGTYNWSVACADNSTGEINHTAGRFFELRESRAPQVTAVSTLTELDLIAGDTVHYTCNATIADDNNISNIKRVNATFFQDTIGTFADNDNNNHYSNVSCVSVQNGTFEANYTCGFSIQYYANNATWNCNVTVEDDQNLSGALDTDVRVNELLALNVSPSFIDYGALFPFDISPDPINMSVTNIGNVDINISLDGYGQTDGDGLAMVCDDGNIPLANQRYAVNSTTPYTNMVSLSDAPTHVANFSLPHRQNDIDYGESRNATYWRLELPGAIKGLCNGTVIFRTYLG